MTSGWWTQAARGVLAVALSCSCSGKLGREWYPNGAPKSLYASLDLGRNVDAEYQSARDVQTVGQNETKGLGAVVSGAVGWKTVDAWQKTEAAKEATNRAAVDGATAERLAEIDSATTLGVEAEETARAALEVAPLP